MQTPKPSSNRKGSSEVPQRTSPATSVTPRSSRVSKTGDNDCNSTTVTPTRTSTDRSSKVAERRSPRSPAVEKRRPSKLSELEAQVNQLQEELKKTKDQLSASESSKKRAQQESEDASKQLQAITDKLEDSQRQLVEFSSAEEARLQELRKISQERDRAWQSELEALQSQHSADSAALSSAMNETQRLKSQLDMAMKSEASQLEETEETKSELQNLKQNMEEALETVENLKVDIQASRKAETEAHAELYETRQHLESSKATIESLQTDCAQLRESLNCNETELLESRATVNRLEEIIKTLNAGIVSETVSVAKSDVSHGEELKSALEEAERKYQEEQVQSTMKIQAAYELVERVKGEYELKETAMEQVLESLKSEIMQLKANLVDKEAELQLVLHTNTELNKEIGAVCKDEMQYELEAKVMKSADDIAELKANLMDKENELQSIVEENETLKSELKKKEMENCKNYEVAVAELELAKAKEQDTLLRLGDLTEEAEKSNKKAARMAEQLDAAQSISSEMEAELKRLRIQSDQWRKAAEAAAAVLTTGNNARLMERTGSLDSDYNSIAGRLMSSPFSDELDDESPKKKNNNVLKKIGGLWKKNPK